MTDAGCDRRDGGMALLSKVNEGIGPAEFTCEKECDQTKIAVQSPMTAAHFSIESSAIVFVIQDWQRQWPKYGGHAAFL